MERRREPRFSVGQPVTIIALDADGSHPDAKFPATLTEISQSGARLSTGRPLAIGSAVRVNLEDTALLGEVCHCSPAAGGYTIGIVVDQVLNHVQDLRRLMSALLGASAGVLDRTRT